MILKGVHIGERQLLVQDLLLLKMCLQMKYGLEILQEKFQNKKGDKHNATHENFGSGNLL